MTKSCKYFLDSEFIEDGRTIDLLSIGIVSEDGRSLYRQNSEANFTAAGDWVWRNVFPRLVHFEMKGQPSCQPTSETYDSGLGHHTKTPCSTDCPWRLKREIRDEVLKFCNQDTFGTPEFWGYYSAYDWVAFCQLFGPMVALPKGYPMFCRDLIQWCKALGNPKLPEQGPSEHGALEDAIWNRKVWQFLDNYKPR